MAYRTVPVHLPGSVPPTPAQVLRLLLGTVLLWLASTAAAAAPAPDVIDALGEPRIESVGLGLIPRNVASVIAMDRAGFMWIGTGDGLVRYDGHKFRPQGRVGKDVLSQNLGLVRALLPTLDGRLWIGTESDGLAVYDPLTETVELRPLIDNGAAGAPTVRALAEDRDGAIWVGTMGQGLQRLDTSTGRVMQLRRSSVDGGLGDDRVLAAVNKGETFETTREALDKLGAAGITRSVMILNGLGGKVHSRQHADNSARLANATQPEYLATLVVSFPMGEQRFRAGFPEWEPLSQHELFVETEQLLSALELKRTVFRSDHASNYLVLKGTLGADKARLLAQVRQAIEAPEQAHLRPAWARGL